LISDALFAFAKGNQMLAEVGFRAALLGTAEFHATHQVGRAHEVRHLDLCIAQEPNCAHGLLQHNPRVPPRPQVCSLMAATQ
jgi:hypothetical protein